MTDPPNVLQPPLPALLHLDKAVEASGEVVFMTDRAGTITYVNPAFSRLYGYAASEAIGRATPRILKSGIVDPKQYESFWQCLLANQVVTGVIVNRTKEGRLLEIESSANPIVDDHGTIVGFLAVQRDITERTRVEAALRESEDRLRQAHKMEAVGRLAGGIAHDFNNLLTTINGYAELALRALPGDDRNRRYLTEIKKAGDRAAALTRQLLAFGRKQVLQPLVLELGALLADVGTMLRRTIGEDIRLVTATSPDLAPVFADPGQVVQILMNLSINSRDAMPDGGEITIEARNAQVGEDILRAHPDATPGSYVLLIVRDTGRGMSDEIKAHIFEPFFTTKGVGKGTGLGLSTVYGIVEQSGGFIDVESEVGVGTTFSIYLPGAVGVADPPAKKASVTPYVRGSETVLLVEDEASVSELLSKILVGAGYVVLEARDPDDALTMTSRYSDPIHLLITDVVMPGMNGWVLASRVLAMRPGIRTLMISGYAVDALEGEDDKRLDPQTPFLQKPFTSIQLLRSVREALDGTTAG